MNQDEKKSIAVTALIIGGFINFLGCIHIVPTIVVTITFVCILILALIIMVRGMTNKGQQKTNLFAKENALLRSAAVFWLVTYFLSILA